MTLAVTGNCQRHLRISFFLIMWIFTYVQMIDQLRLELSDLSCHTQNLPNTNQSILIEQPIKLITHETDLQTVDPFLFASGEI
jgi:hypothetical protein